MPIISVYKPIGKTPLQMIRELQNQPGYENEKMTYAGRLDPMAEGVLIILSGNDVHRKDDFLKLDKQYKATILFGIETDTQDILGIANACHEKPIIDRQSIESLSDDIFLSPPRYSSQIINGKPSFYWARNEPNSMLELPTKKMHIFHIDQSKPQSISGETLLTSVLQRIALVDGDFRQKEICASWRTLLSRKNDTSFITLDLLLDVTSGTYIRSIAQEIGKRCGSCALLYSLVRTRVGSFMIEDSISF